ncbi:MAG: pentapeptide repeat-containing protein [Bacteroidia bacterium]
MRPIDLKTFWEEIHKGWSSFENTVFDFKINLLKKGTPHPGLYFSNCHFKEEVKFSEIEFNAPVIFEDCIFDDSIHFKNSKFASNLVLDDITSDFVYFHSGEFYFTSIKPTKVNFIQIEGGSFKNKLWITDETQENSRILKNLTFNFDKVDGNIDIDLIKIEKILLSGINKSNFSLNDITAKELMFYRFFNAGYLTIDWWKRELNNSSLVITNSNLKNVEITNSDLAHLGKIEISASNLTDLSIINCSLKETILSPDGLPLDEALRSQKDAYRQLKISMSRQGDKVNELKFHSLEMHTYFKMLSWKKNFWTKLILGYDKITSNFNQNLKLALFWLFFTHFLLYICLLKIFSYQGIEISYKNAEIKYFWAALGDYLTLLIPTHKFTETAPSAAETIDFLMRFFSSIFIYNVIKVTRRFARG